MAEQTSTVIARDLFKDPAIMALPEPPNPNGPSTAVPTKPASAETQASYMKTFTYDVEKEISASYPDVNSEQTSIAVLENKKLTSTNKNTGTKITKTTLPDLLFINLANSTEFVKKFTNFLDLVGDYENELDIAIEYFKTQVSNDVVTKQTEFFNNLEIEKMKNLDDDFIYFWYKKFKTAIDEVQEQVKSKKGSDLGFLGDFSDSIGTLLNQSYKIDDSIVPVADMNCSLYGPPILIPPTLNSKISENTRSLMTDMSRKNTSLMRTNLIRIQKTSDLYNILIDSTKPHGLNLVTDINFHTNFKGYLSELVDRLKTLLGKTYEFAIYFSNINDTSAYNPRMIGSARTGANLQKIKTLHITKNVENRKQYIDLNQKKIQKSVSDRSTRTAIVATVSYKTRDASLSNLTNPGLNNTNVVNVNQFGVAMPEFIYQAFVNRAEILKDNLTPRITSQLQNLLPNTGLLTGGLGSLGSFGGLGNLNLNNFNMAGYSLPFTIPSASPLSFSSLQSLGSANQLLSIGQQFAGFQLPAMPLGNFSSLQSFTPGNFGYKQSNFIPKVSITGFLNLIGQFASMIPGLGFIGKIMSSISSLFGGSGGGTSQGGLQKLQEGFNNKD